MANRSIMNLLVAGLLLISCMGYLVQAAGLMPINCDLNMIRLPEIFEPDHYDIHIEPDLDAMTFKGKVDIIAEFLGLPHPEFMPKKCSALERVGKFLGKRFGCRTGGKQSTNIIHDEDEICDQRIVLNVGRLINLANVEVFKYLNGKSEGPNLVKGVCFDRPNQMMAINLNRRARSLETFKIQLSFSSSIGIQSRGYFQSPHVNPITGKPFANTNTHFFPADARSAFPCFDEPDFKARFSLTIVHRNDLQAISNTKIASQTNSGSMVTTKFELTHTMSSYNFAFAVGHYESQPCATDSRVKAWVPIGDLERAQLVLNTICNSISVGQNFFDRQFPLKKLDLVLTKTMRDPSRENWGMLVITEDFFLTDADTTNVLKVEIAKLAVHITLHQWWGDLITAKWWDDQWIFDGFTIWQSHWSAAKLYPEFDYDFNYLLRLQSPMLDAHATEQVHAIKTYKPLTADEEIALFDTNTFNKAGAIYQMLSSINPERFQAGLKNLLNKKMYSTADANDFIEVVGKSLELDIELLLYSWLNQAGLPLLSVQFAGNSTDGRQLLEVRQERLLPKTSHLLTKERWIIPVNYQVHGDIVGQEVYTSMLMHDYSGTIELPDWFNARNPRHFVKLNTNFDGFYRVQYNDGLLERLAGPIRAATLPQADRFNVIDDLKALVKSGYLEYYDKLREALSWFSSETNGGVISGLALVLPVVSAAHKSLGRPAEEIQKLATDLFKPTYEAHGFSVVEGQTHATMNGRQDALIALVANQYQPAIDEALQVFEQSDVHLTPFLRKPVYLSAANHGNDAQFEQLIQRLRGTKSLFERSSLVNSIVPYVTNVQRKAAMSATLSS